MCGGDKGYSDNYSDNYGYGDGGTATMVPQQEESRLEPVKTNLRKYKILDVLEQEDGLIEGSLCQRDKQVCGHEGRCAMGALLFWAGVSNAQLINLQDNDGASAEDIWADDLYRDLLVKEYGVGLQHVQSIISANDANSGYGYFSDPDEGARARRRKVMERVEALEDYDREDVFDLTGSYNW